jgi:hypothetical protein
MGLDFDALLAKARPPERTVHLCLREDLRAEWDQLQVELSRANQADITSLGGGGEARQVSERIRAVEAEMDAAKAPFRFRALDPDAWKALTDAHPPREEQGERQFNADTFPPALIAACCVDPVMTPAQVGELFRMLSHGQRGELFDCAWETNVGRADVPFSVLASALTRGSGE